VVDQRDVGAGRAQAERHPQRVGDELGAHARRELPADDLAAVGVDDEAEEDDAFPAAQVREIRQPQPIRCGSGEVTVDQVRAARRGRIRGRRAPRAPAALGAHDPSGAHQPLDAVAARGLAGAAQRLVHPPVAVGVVVVGVQRPDDAEQPLIVDVARGPLPAGALVVRGRRHVQDTAHRLDAEAIAVVVDQHAHLVRSASS
jgi:hypothetical protein